MSRSNPTSTVNPVTRRYSWNGQKGGFKYYDRQTQTNIEVELPFVFIPLDNRHGVSGWSNSDNSGIWSNHIKTFSEELTVRSKSGIIAKGLYSDIKDKVKANGGRYASFVYIAYKDGEALKIGTIEFKGSAVNAWIEFQKTVDINTVAVKVAQSEEGKVGSIKYFVPVFSSNEIAEETNQKAIELDKELQKMFNGGAVTQEEEAVIEEAENIIEDEIDDLPF